MREFGFSLTYDSGVDPVADVFTDNPSLIARSVACCVTQASMWRVDRVSGSPDSLDAVDDVFISSPHCTECVGGCENSRHHELLASDRTSRTVYSFLSELDGCHSIPYLAASHLGDGLLFHTSRRADTYVWRVLVPDGAAVGELYDDIQRTFPDGVRVDLQHLGSPSYWCEGAVSIADLPYEQREALEAAVDHGYYDHPRETTVAEIADTLGVPRSTLQYRLQRAESWLASTFVDSAALP